MFLTARLFGIATYVFVMVIFLLLIKYTKQSQTKYIVLFYLISLCAIAYFFVPHITTDLFRHNLAAKKLAELDWHEFWYIVTNSVSGIFTLFYFRYFSNYLATMTCFVIYGVIFYILYKSVKQNNSTKGVLLIVLFWIMTNDFYLTSISNIRSYIAVVFVSLCIYREIFQHKFGPINIFLYLCAIEAHSMGIVLVTFRFFAYLLMRGQLTFWKIVLFPVIIAIVILEANFYLPLLDSSVDRFEGYYEHVEYNYIWERVIFTIQTIVQVYILIKSYTYKIFNENKFVYYKSVVTMAVVVLIICNLNVVFMQRWIIFSAVLEIPILIRLLQKEYELNKKNMRNFMITTSLITFAFVCSRGNLCSLKFWE